MSSDALSARLLATFLEELDEQVRALNEHLLALETSPGDRERLTSVFRIAHTLKGAARAANVPLVEGVCHRLESLLVAAGGGGGASHAPLDLALLFEATDALADAGARLRAGKGLNDSPLAALAARLAAHRGGDAARAATRPDLHRKTTPVSSPAPATAATPTPPEASGPGDGFVRVRSEKLEALSASAAQLLINAGRAAEVAGELDALRDLAMHWSADWRRSGGALRAAVERAGAGAEAMSALDTMERNLQQLARGAAQLAEGMARSARTSSLLADDLMERVRAVRMRPFAEAVEALPRAVRDLAAEVGKEVELDVSGGAIEADRVILDGLREALLQLVRNAADHGIETPDERERRGKPRRGTIGVSASLRGDSIVVTVADDGGGLDLSAVRAALGALGRPLPADDRALAQVLFEVGFSTRGEASAISGRGVGLDIVKSAMDRIRGSVDVSWEDGGGTSFTLTAPLTLATVRALLVTVGPQVVAIPTGAVERLDATPAEEVRQIDGQHVVPTPDGLVPLATLARLLGPPMVERPAEGRLRIVRLRAGRRRLAVVVDDMLSEEEIVVRPIERLEHPVPQLTGATLLPSGRVALVVNPRALHLRAAEGEGLGISLADRPDARAPRRRILVVDDSITTRTLEQSLLEAAGFDVTTAVDGADAWRLVQERGCDLVVTDIEMPRMDGFALTEAIRGSARFRELPVVLVTSLESAEHRARGLEAGADAYIVKSSFDQEALLATIRQLLR